MCDTLVIHVTFQTQMQYSMLFTFLNGSRSTGAFSVEWSKGIQPFTRFRHHYDKTNVFHVFDSTYGARLTSAAAGLTSAVEKFCRRVVRVSRMSNLSVLSPSTTVYRNVNVSVKFPLK